MKLPKSAIREQCLRFLMVGKCVDIELRVDTWKKKQYHGGMKGYGRKPVLDVGDHTGSCYIGV